MTNTNTSNRVMPSRQAIERALRLLPDQELVSVEALARKALASEKRYGGADELIPMLKNPAYSHACKSVSLFIFQAWRLWSSAALVQSVAALKDLGWLDKKIRTLRIHRNLPPESPQPEGQAAASADAGATVDFVREGIIKVYQFCLGRTPVEEEIAIWKNNFADGLDFPQFLCILHDCPEGVAYRKNREFMQEMSDGKFVQLVFEAMFGRCPVPRESRYWEERLEAGDINRTDFLLTNFSHFLTENLELRDAKNTHDGLSCSIMGTGKYVSVTDWHNKARELEREPRTQQPEVYRARFHIKSEPKVLVSAIASLYKGGKFIEQFMDNITSQTCFDDYCELVIIDADSPENEAETIERYCKRHKNIVYRRMDYRIGIYDAWNVGVKLSKGEYLTNTNLDDIRRGDSFELQAGVLDNLPFVDVVYQDFLYTFDPRLPVEEIVRFGYKSHLPVVSPINMMDFNSPHNAPMWRKRLHDELGYFDTSFQSAGDYEFWLRCLAAGKVFYKTNDPHVVYYQNPEGLSTRPDSRGVEESKRIHRTYGRRLISENAVMPMEDFAQMLKLKLGPRSFAGTNETRYGLAQKALQQAAVTQKYPKHDAQE